MATHSLSRRKCRLRRQMKYREKCQREDMIRALRLNIMKSQETKSVEDIIDEIYGLTPEPEQRKTLTLKPTAYAPSGDNCCLSTTAVYSTGNYRNPPKREYGITARI